MPRRGVDTYVRVFFIFGGVKCVPVLFVDDFCDIVSLTGVIVKRVALEWKIC